MTVLRIHTKKDPTDYLEIQDFEEIQNSLGAEGVRFERWEAASPLPTDSTEDEILTAYADSIERLKKAGGYTNADVVALTPDSPNKAELREKFLAEHTHTGDEVRFFVDGSGLFYVPLADRVFAIECGKGDLLVVPSGAPHWFDMGPEPFFKCIRLFTNPSGWEAHFTGSGIAEKYPLYGRDYAAGPA